MDSIVKDRDIFIGGSDIPAICELMLYEGMSKYGLHIKKHLSEPKEEQINIFAQFGNENEEQVTAAVNAHLGTNFVKTDDIKVEDTGLQNYKYRGNLDGLDEHAVLEVKCRVKPRLVMSDILQAHFYCFLTGRREFYIAVGHIDDFYSLGDDILLYHFKFNDKVWEFIMEHIKAFDALKNVFINFDITLSLKEEMRLAELYKMKETPRLKLQQKEEDLEWYYQLQRESKETISSKIS